jgi:hypothetical protein
MEQLKKLSKEIIYWQKLAANQFVVCQTLAQTQHLLKLLYSH